jgi:ketosteroid isomerase-like protein
MTRKRIFSALFLLSILFLFDSCTKTESTNTSNLEEAKKAIAESNDIYFQSFVKNDSSLFINRYAEDCCIMGPNAPAVCGPNAALEFFRIAYHDFGLRNGKFITQEVFGMGDEYVVEVGLWQSFDANNVLMDDGKFLVLWKKTPTGWKMFRDSFSSNRPIPPME